MKKTTSQKLTKKLAQYGALAAAIGTIAETNGQVMYTDIADFEGDSASSFELDLNGDTVVDFTINGSSIQILVDANANSIVGTLGAGPYKYPFALNSNDVIDANQPWESSNGQILRYKTSTGAASCQYSSKWCGDTVDKYLGLKFIVGGNTHYGWVRLDVTVPDSMDDWVVKDFAYEATPDTPIAAGAGILNVAEYSIQTEVQVRTDGSDIVLSNLPSKTSYNLYALTGQIVMSGNVEGNSHTLETSMESSGVYVLELTDVVSNASIRQKIVL